MTERLKKAVIRDVESGLALRKARALLSTARVALDDAEVTMQAAQAENNRSHLDYMLALDEEAEESKKEA